MNNRILVAFATTHGSTKEAAERITAALSEKQLDVDLQEAKAVRSISEYTAVVLGFPLYMFKMHRDGRRFLARFHRNFRNGLPLAIFAGGPIEPDRKEEQMQDAREHLLKELDTFPDIQPNSVLVIGGRFQPDSLRMPWKVIPAMKQMPAADLRDWDEITGWAQNLAELLPGQPGE